MSDSRPPGFLPRVFRTGVLLAGAAATLIAAFALWLLGTAAGAQFALQRAVALAGQGSLGKVEGRLIGPLALEMVAVSAPGLQLRAERLTLDWSPVRLLAGEVHLQRLHALSLDVRTASSAEPLRAPATLALPWRLRVDRAGVDRLRLGQIGEADGGFSLRDLSLQIAADGESWRVGNAEALTDIGRARLSGSVGSRAPFTLALKGEIAGARNGSAYRATLAGTGSLARIEVTLEGQDGGLAGQARALVEPFAAAPLRSLSANLTGLDLAAFTRAPRTSLTVEAALAPREGAILAGPVKVVNGLPGPLDKQRLPVASAAAELVVARGRLEAKALVLGIAGGGSAKGDAAWSAGSLDARLTVRDADLLAWHSALRATALSGDISAVASAQAQSFTVALADPRFAIEGRARIAAGRLSVERARLARGAAFLEASGFLALEGGREFSVAGSVHRFDPAAFAKVPAGDLNASFAASGRLAGQAGGEAKLQIAKSRFAGLAAEGTLALAGSASRVTRAQADLSLGLSRLVVEGALGGAGDALQVKLSSPDLAPIGRALGLALGGRAAFDARVAGEWVALSGRASLAASDLRLPGGTRVASVEGNVDVGAGEGGAAIGTLAILGVSRQGEKEPLLQRAAVAIQGTRAAHEIRLEASLPEKRGARATLFGGVVAGPRFPQWRGRLETLETTGQAAFALAAPAAFDASAERVELGEALFVGEPGSVRLAFTRWTPTGLESRGSSSAVVVRTVRNLLKLQEEVGSNLVLAGDWDLRVGESVDGFVALRRESGDVRLGEPRQALGLETLALRVEATAGRVKAAFDMRGKQAGQWTGEAAATVVRADGGWEIARHEPVSGRFRVSVPDLAWMAAWLGPDARLAGRITGEGALAGTPQEPTWSGRVEATGLQVREPTLGAEVADGTIALVLQDRQARIERFLLSAPWQPDAEAARAIAGAKRPPAGTITAEGAVDLGTRQGALTLRAAGYPLTRLPTRFLAVSGEGRAQFDGLNTALSGAFTADAGWFGIPASAPPSLSEDVIVVRGEEKAPSPRGTGQIRLDLRVGLGEQLYFQGRGLSTRLAGDLRLAGVIGAGLRTTGTIRAIGGTFDAYGRTLAIERGTLSFLGPIDNPGLNVLALRKGLPVEAGVEVVGTVARPKARLVSSPDVPDSEKLAWLVLGRGRGDISSADAATLVGAANAILGQETIPAAKLIRTLGLDEVSIGAEESGVLGAMPQSTVAGRTGGTSYAEVVTVGKQVSDNIRVSYKQGLADAEGSLRVALQFTQSLQFILRAGYEPGIDAVYRFSFR